MREFWPYGGATPSLKFISFLYLIYRTEYLGTIYLFAVPPNRNVK